MTEKFSFLGLKPYEDFLLSYGWKISEKIDEYGQFCRFWLNPITGAGLRLADAVREQRQAIDGEHHYLKCSDCGSYRLVLKIIREKRCKECYLNSAGYLDRKSAKRKAFTCRLTGPICMWLKKKYPSKSLSESVELALEPLFFKEMFDDSMEN